MSHDARSQKSLTINHVLNQDVLSSHNKQFAPQDPDYQEQVLH